jgi:hypothetical protein
LRERPLMQPPADRLTSAMRSATVPVWRAGSRYNYVTFR